MSELPILSGSEIRMALEKIGYKVVRQRGSHIRLSCLGRSSVTVPDYHDISRGLLRKILRDVDITTEQFMDLLEK